MFASFISICLRYNTHRLSSTKRRIFVSHICPWGAHLLKLHVDMIPCHNFCKFVCCILTPPISCSTTSQMCSAGSRSSDSGGSWNQLNSLSYSFSFFVTWCYGGHGGSRRRSTLAIMSFWPCTCFAAILRQTVVFKLRGPKSAKKTFLTPLHHQHQQTALVDSMDS